MEEDDDGDEASSWGWRRGAFDIKFKSQMTTRLTTRTQNIQNIDSNLAQRLVFRSAPPPVVQKGFPIAPLPIPVRPSSLNAKLFFPEKDVVEHL